MIMSLIKSNGLYRLCLFRKTNPLHERVILLDIPGVHCQFLLMREYQDLARQPDSDQRCTGSVAKPRS